MQLNGGFGVNFSDVPEGEKEEMDKKFSASLEMVNKRLIPTGVTSYLPTLTSQRPEVYHRVCKTNRGHDYERS